MKFTRHFLFIALLAGLSLMTVKGFAFSGTHDETRIRSAVYGNPGYEIKLVRRDRDDHRHGDRYRGDRYYGRHHRYDRDRDRDRHYRHYKRHYGSHYYKPRYYPYYRPYSYYYGPPYGYYYYGPSFGFGFNYGY